MRKALPFNFEAPVSMFFKADAQPGKQRRIGGIISTETPDREGEIVLQRGLDFSYFTENGWFNDNHSKATTDILGYPENVKRFQKGDVLPDGSKAKAAGTWSEGYLLETEKANKVWELGQALQKTGRRLGYSVEGRIEKREGPKQNIIAKAVVRNVAITNCPVNSDARLEILAKSLVAAEKSESEDEELVKMLMAGPANSTVLPTGPQTGAGAGRLLMPRSLEGDMRDLTFGGGPKRVKKSLTDAEAMVWLKERIPGATWETLERVVTLTKAWKTQGTL